GDPKTHEKHRQPAPARSDPSDQGDGGGPGSGGGAGAVRPAVCPGRSPVVRGGNRPRPGKPCRPLFFAPVGQARPCRRRSPYPFVRGSRRDFRALVDRSHRLYIYAESTLFFLGSAPPEPASPLARPGTSGGGMACPDPFFRLSPGLLVSGAHIF